VVKRLNVADAEAIRSGNRKSKMAITIPEGLFQLINKVVRPFQRVNILMGSFEELNIYLR